LGCGGLPCGVERAPRRHGGKAAHPEKNRAKAGRWLDWLFHARSFAINKKHTHPAQGRMCEKSAVPPGLGCVIKKNFR